MCAKIIIKRKRKIEVRKAETIDFLQTEKRSVNHHRIKKVALKHSHDKFAKMMTEIFKLV